MTFSIVIRLTSQVHPFFDTDNCRDCHDRQNSYKNGTLSQIYNISQDDAMNFAECICATDVINLSLEYIYLAFLILSFILALGQRPKGSVATYITSFGVFAVCQVYLLICSCMFVTFSTFTHYTVYLAISALLGMDGQTFGNFISHFFTGPVGVIIVALGSTFGLYFLASFICLDAWHMFHSFPQYLLLAPSYVNVLNVYSFCNTHDVSWGTKGSDTIDALPALDTKKNIAGPMPIVEETEQEQSDIDNHFEQTVKRALAPLSKETRPEKPTLEDGYRAFRTNLIIAWVFSNLMLILAFTSQDIQTSLGIKTPSSARTATYFKVVLWSTALLALVRFLGCFIFVAKTFTLRIPGFTKR